MLKFNSTLFCCLLLVQGFAQFTISGHVKSVHTDRPLLGATIQADQKNYFSVVDQEGRFEIYNVPAGKYMFRVRFLGFKEKIIPLVLHKNEWMDIALEEKSEWGEEVIVYATRVSNQSPVAFTYLDKKRIQKQNTNRDMPFILSQIPSLTTTSDAGIGVGYTGLRIRGSDATRINITLNGIPFNDSESHGVFWVNMPDIASSAKSIQVQRGVGGSTNGAGAFGASININTSVDRQRAYAEMVNSYGSFNTHRHTLSFGSGTVAKNFIFDGRLSLIQSDGFVDRASADLRSFYFSGKYQGKKTTLETMIFGGNEITYQSWYGVPASRLKSEAQGMLVTASVEGWDAKQKDHLYTSNSRTFNIYTYKNQVDNYTQEHYQLHGSRKFNPFLIANMSLHYTYGRGYFEELKNDQKFVNYGVGKPIIQDLTIEQTNLIRRRELDNHFYGITYSTSYKKQKYNATIGGAWNRYQGAHFGKIIWTDIVSAIPNNFQYYFNWGDKYDFNLFWKNNYKITQKIQTFLDLQYRRIDYQATGIRPTKQGLTAMKIDVKYNFFNPKIGITYTLADHNRLYISYSVAHREPVRDDFINAPTNSPPKSEVVYDMEMGWKVKRKKYSFNINGYWMRYENQLVLAGEVNDVGASIRTGVPKSYRIGLEIEATIQLSRKLTWHPNIAFSENKIEHFTETVYDYGLNFDQQQKIQSHFKNTDISFSPSTIVGSEITYVLREKLECVLLTKYVSDQFLDNTSNHDRKVSAYLVNDLKLTYSLKPRFMKQIALSVFINNLFDESYESHGYTYGYIGGGKTVRQNYYFPQAGINYMVMLSLLL